ncbi:MAG: PqqD family protein [Tannerella sp.]|jgi:hypothetical protein|nr:PqqD family protein [Tannerella sp.]
MDKSVYKINSNISWKLLKDKVVAVNTDNGNYYTNNYTSSLIWQWVDQAKTMEELALLMQEEFPENSDSIPQDIKEIINYWLSEKLINKV